MGLVAFSLVGCRPAAEQPSLAPEEIRGELIDAPETREAASPEPSFVTPVEEPTPLAEPEAPPVEPTAATTADEPRRTSAAPQLRDGVLMVGFDHLSDFNFEIPSETPIEPAKADAQIPLSVQALDKKRVSLKGFMLPLKVEAGAVTEFLIMRDQSMCCFGTVPRINEWVSVKAGGGGVKPIMDQAVNVTGTLHVGSILENGYLVGIYRMDGEKLTTAEN